MMNYFDLTVPVMLKNLTNVKSILMRGWNDAQERGMTEEAFLAQALAPDMFHLGRQVQIVTDNAKGMTARLAGVEAMSIEDNETTVDELLNRIDVVIEYISTFKPEQFEQAAQQKIVLKYMPGQYQTGAGYALSYAIPNFFFHMSMIYALLRKQGAPLGKTDFIGGLTLHPLA
jgi:uncharacterized protein